MSTTLDQSILLKQNEIPSYDAFSKQVLEELLAQGIYEFCVCPGARNAPLIYPLAHSSEVVLYYWPEERSAAFFALGRIKATGRPIAVVTTSGTASAELLPATIEAYYTSLPLVLITADRPRRFRGSGAPQSVEQVELFHPYTHHMLDLEAGEIFQLNKWKRFGPIHLNLCFEEPQDAICQKIRLNAVRQEKISEFDLGFSPDDRYLHFLQHARFPLVVVGSLAPRYQEEAIRFLLHLNAPVYLEGISGIREEPRLAHLRITCADNIWQYAVKNDYPIDSILRLGGIPTARLWRDLENKQDEVLVCSISEQPFSGLSHATVIHASLSRFFTWAKTVSFRYPPSFEKWKQADVQRYKSLLSLFSAEPLAEQSLIHQLSRIIPTKSKVYLGNSLPIREWDQASTYEPRQFQMACNRGANGIDGQLSTFLGYCTDEQENWAILGDLTLLYDLVAPWITSQLSDIHAHVVVINNKGAGIFERMFALPAFQNSHQLNFQSLAEFWNWGYEQWTSIPATGSSKKGTHFIELIPDPEATQRFLQTLKLIQ